MSHSDAAPTAEHERLDACVDGGADWRLWGPCLAGRQRGTVREDYSAAGDALGYFPFDHAHLRAYRWGEDGIAGLADGFGFLCLAVALWNGKDDRLKERPLHIVPQLWFRNTWAWGRDDRTPSLHLASHAGQPPRIAAHHDLLGDLVLEVENPGARVLFCDNETNAEALWGTQPGPAAYPKDGVNRAVVLGDTSGVNPTQRGTKVGVDLTFDAVPPTGTVTMRLRLRGAGHVGWAQHPDGALPAYEWAFGDVNPAVHAWAAWQVYCIDGCRDRDFLVGILTKLLMNFSSWLNRKDPDGSNLFAGGFLGLDNIALFDRSRDVPSGWRLEQSDATAWMAFYCMTMLRIAVELGHEDDVWSDLAITFRERFLAIAEAIESSRPDGSGLWDERDGFFYDTLVPPSRPSVPMRVRSLVGLLPLLAVATLPDWTTTCMPRFLANLGWLDRHRPDLTHALVGPSDEPGVHRLLRIVDPHRLERLLDVMLDEHELLSDHGIRSLSAAYATPNGDGFSEDVAGHLLGIRYDPGESSTELFGGNSNWRGPVWFPVNCLLIDALRLHADALGPGFTAPFPTGSDQRLTLDDIADRLGQRLRSLFRPHPHGRRPSTPRDQGSGPLWAEHPTFSEYFHGDTGAGLGASHQTGWTALVAHLICTSPAPSPPETHPPVEPQTEQPPRITEAKEN